MFGFIVSMIIIVAIIKSAAKHNNTINNSSNINEIQRQQNQQFMDDMDREQQRQFMEESMKTVTPWEHGGYDMNQGNSFNDHNNGMF